MSSLPPFENRPDLLRDPVGRTLVRLTLPMIAGIAAVILFSVVDTIYVGRLGTEPLAAMGFTFPVTFVVMNLVMGIGMGVSSAISRAIGEGDRRRVRRLATDSLVLGLLLVLAVSGLGLCTIDPLFRSLGAPERLLPRIKEYMVPWYAGVGLLVVPMVGNSAIRATGDMKSPSIIMLCAGGVNIVLDPFLIFGIGPFPRLELTGAALATLFSWLVTLVPALWILRRRERLLVLSACAPREIWASFRAILYVGIPASATNMLVPLSTGILTRMVSDHGAVAVAAFGAATRVEALAMIGIFALSTAVAPFVGQNFGAQRGERVTRAVRLSGALSLTYGLAMAVLLAVAAYPIAFLFNEQTEVVRTTATYLTIVPLSYGSLGTAIAVNSTLNAVNEPFKSAGLIVLRMFFLVVPFAYVGNRLFGLHGLFAGVCAGNVLIGAIAYWVFHRARLNWIPMARFQPELDSRRLGASAATPP